MTGQGLSAGQLGMVTLTLWVIVALVYLFITAIEADRRNRRFIDQLKAGHTGTSKTPGKSPGDSQKENGS